MTVFDDSVKKPCTRSPSPIQQQIQKVSPLNVGDAMEVSVKFGPPIGNDGTYSPCKVEVKSKPKFALDLSEQQNKPLVVAIMDISGSMAGKSWSDAMKALLYFVSVRTHDMELCIVLYNATATVVLEPTLNPSEDMVRSLLENVKPEQSTLFKPALEEALKTSSNAFGEKRPVTFAFFTDGMDFSPLETELQDFKSLGVKNEVLNIWATQDRFRVHCIGIGIDGHADILPLMASFGKQPGESLTIQSDDIPKVMGALYATIMEGVPDLCVVTMESTNDGSSVQRIVMPLSLQVASEITSTICCFVPKGHLLLTLALGDQLPFFKFETSSIPSFDDGDVASNLDSITAALSFMYPTMVKQVETELMALDFEAALEKVTKAMDCIRCASQLVSVEEVNHQMLELQECIKNMELNVREHSAGSTSRAFSRMSSEASLSLRQLSGAPALVETDGRMMSHAARSLSRI